MNPGREIKTLIGECILGVIIIILYGGVPVQAGTVTAPELARIKIENRPRFVRLRFSFKGGLPQRSDTALYHQTLKLYFSNTRNGAMLPLISATDNLIKAIHIYAPSKDVIVKIHLSCQEVEYVKYQRRFPPEVVVYVRKMKRPVKKMKGNPSVSHHSEGRKAFHHKRETERCKVPLQQIRFKRATVIHISSHQGNQGPYTKGTKPRREKQAGRGPSKKLIAHGDFVSTTTSTASAYPPTMDRAALVLFREAGKVWLKSEYTRAGKMYKELLDRDPASREGMESAFFWARSEFFLVQEGKRRIREVIEDYEDILEQYQEAPWKPRALLDLGQLYTQEGRDARSIDIYLQIITSFPPSPTVESAYICLAELQIKQHTYNVAEKTLHSYLKLFPRGSYVGEATYLLGDAFYYQGEIRQAIKTYHSAMNRWPLSTQKNLTSLEKIATHFEKNGEMEHELDLLFLALNISTSNQARAALMSRIAGAYLRMGKPREARKITSILQTEIPASEKATHRSLETARSHNGRKTP